MPGTIKVSVLYLMDLPSPSSSVSRETNLISVKVFMGKREYQTWGKEDFLFPLISLREKLIVALYDVDGNEITQRDFETKFIVEKGFWDDSFSIEGGGKIIVKFQFVLSDDERSQIRHMRESILKKKNYEELLKRSVSRLKSVNDLQESVVGTKNVKFSDELVERSVLNPVSQPNATQSGPESREESPIDRVDQRAPDGRETSSPAPPSEELQKNAEHLPEYNAPLLTEADYDGSERTLETGSPTTDMPQRQISSQEGFDPQLRHVEPIPADKITQMKIGSHDALNPQSGRKKSIPADKITQSQIASPEALDPQLGREESIPADKTTERQIASQEALDPQLGHVEPIPTDKITQTQIASQETLDSQLGHEESILTDKITQSQIASQEALDPQLGCVESISANKITQKQIAFQEALDPQLEPADSVPADKITQSPLASQVALDPQFGRVESNPEVKITQKQTASQEALDPQLGCVELIPAYKITKDSTLASPLRVEDKARTSGPETKKAPSSVKKMISAFETSLPQQERIARVNPTTKLLSNKIKRDGSLKGTGVEDLGTKTNKAMKKVAEQREETMRQLNLEPKKSYVAAGPETVRKDEELLVYKMPEFELNPRLQKTVEHMDHRISSKESLNLEGMTNVLKPIATKETDILRGSVEKIRKNQDSLFGVHRNTSMYEGYKDVEEDIILDGRKEDPVDPVAQTADGSSYGTRLSQVSDQFEILVAESNSNKHISSNEDRMDEDVNFHVVYKTPTTNVMGDFSDDPTEGVTATEAMVSGNMLDESAENDQPRSLPTDREDSSLNAHLDSRWRNCRDDSDDPSTCGASIGKQKPVRCPLVNPCSWILPNEARRLCITTASKQLRNLVECCGVYIETHLSEMSLSSVEATEQNVCVDTSISVNKNDKASCNLRTAKLKSSMDASKILEA